jgi:hypothetical protein
METKNEIMVLADKSIPAVFKNAQLTFDAGKNIFLTDGYTSQAGNTYFQGIRFSDRIVITQQVGIGYFYTFLNGIRIFGFNGKEATLIAEKSYHCCIYRESYVQTESENLIRDFLQSQSVLSGSIVENNVLDSFSKNIVADTMKNQLPYQKQLNA